MLFSDLILINNIWDCLLCMILESWLSEAYIVPAILEYDMPSDFKIRVAEPSIEEEDAKAVYNAVKEECLSGGLAKT